MIGSEERLGARIRPLSRTTGAALVLGLALSATSSALADPANIRLNEPLPSGSNVSQFAISSDGSRVVYTADQDAPGVIELYSVPIDRSSGPTRLNGALVSGGDVRSFAVTPDSSRVIYTADQDTAGAGELYSVPLDGGSAPIKLNDTLISGGDVESFFICPDSSRVVYLADQDQVDVLELYSVPVDGSESPTKLNNPLVSGGDVQYPFHISPDSSRVVYSSDQDANDVFQLYSVPVDGSESPVLLNDPLVSGGNVRVDFVISTDSSRVAYRAYQALNLPHVLYSVPLDGSSDPVELSGSLVGGGEVQSGFLISADSSRVVYRADQDVDEVFELYSAPLEGGSGPVKISGTLVAGGDVQLWFLTSSDSSRVVYAADQDTDEIVELYSVNLDDGSGLTKLNYPLVAGGDVQSFAVTPDSSRVVYTADQDVDDMAELFSVPLDGSSGPTQLNPTLHSGGDVGPFDISPDSERVAYRADQGTDEVVELYSVPLDGSTSSSKLNGPLVSGGRVGWFDTSPDSSRVVYLAEQDTDGVWEVYASDAIFVLTVGVAADLSGPQASIGWPSANAVQLAISQTNSAGGVAVGEAFYTLALVTADSSCDSTQAITAANTLLNAGAAAVVGHTCTSSSAAAQPMYAAAGVPMISPSSTGPALTEQGYTTTFRVVSRDDAAAVRLASHLVNWEGLDRAAVIDLSGFAGNRADAFSTTFSSGGGAITGRQLVTSTADYTAALTAIQAAGPTVIFYADSDGGAAGHLSNIAHTLGMTDVVVAWTPQDGGAQELAPYAAAAGAAAEGDHAGLLYRRTDDMRSYDTFNADYQAAGFSNYGADATVWGAFAYDAAGIIIAALDCAGSTEPAAIRDQIAATGRYIGVVGSYGGFDANGDVIPQWAWLERFENGQWVLIQWRVVLPVVFRDGGD